MKLDKRELEAYRIGSGQLQGADPSSLGSLNLSGLCGFWVSPLGDAFTQRPPLEGILKPPALRVVDD